MSYLIKNRMLIFADRADGTFQFDGIKADSFKKYDFIRIQLQQVGVDHGTQINSNLLELDPPDSYRD